MSNTVVWTSLYDVQIDDFNKQHKRLFDIINHLFSAMEARKDKATMDEVFAELLEYTESHFRQEEDLMRLHDYPEKNLTEHLSQHKMFIQKVTELQNNFKRKHYSVSVDLLLFLQSWLITHIMTIDKKYTAFFKEKGVI